MKIFRGGVGFTRGSCVVFSDISTVSVAFFQFLISLLSMYLFLGHPFSPDEIRSLSVDEEFVDKHNICLPYSKRF